MICSHLLPTPLCLVYTPFCWSPSEAGCVEGRIALLRHLGGVSERRRRSRGASWGSILRARFARLSIVYAAVALRVGIVVHYQYRPDDVETKRVAGGIGTMNEEKTLPDGPATCLVIRSALAGHLGSYWYPPLSIRLGSNRIVPITTFNAVISLNGMASHSRCESSSI
ncbi:hypothetical protein BU26DRAFT_318605 [Trematosphaeria pertusa]|uniref:Uncharacterized protein n=1 Tax=Trematosphaeria pertusa TaxID=390896 RepID=A0A6A6IHT5_9PLEO|nr:uncharacterized protein BU26DRAFT_318605 [Trematosphaeria pertusa]KAF2249472.1 hypothetical protein BU26DRAFT_318605 [Trematosphaeria pertusa]